MGLHYPEVVQRSLRYVQSRYMRQIFLCLVMLTSWTTSTSTQASAGTTPQPCGGTLIGSGTIRSPNYPLSYPNNARCSWRLLPISNDTDVGIQFNFFALENYYDYITIQDERNISKWYTGSDKPPKLLAGKIARIEFYSDESIADLGFSASFSSIKTTHYPPLDCLWLGKFWCSRSVQCVPMSNRCNHNKDCVFGEDEDNCTTTTRSPQSECLSLGKFWCSRSVQCVPMSNRCNNNKDCVYGEDEDSCTTTTRSPKSECLWQGKFWCSWSVQCVPMSNRCNHHKDCVYGEDEDNCPRPDLFSQSGCVSLGRFWCSRSLQCVLMSNKCNNKNECIFGEDEDGCPIPENTSRTTILIVVVSVSGFTMFLIPLVAIMRAEVIRNQRQATPTSNISLRTTVRPTATGSSTPATYAGQFGTSDRQDGGPQGTRGLPLDQDAPPFNDFTV